MIRNVCLSVLRVMQSLHLVWLVTSLQLVMIMETMLLFRTMRQLVISGVWTPRLGKSLMALIIALPLQIVVDFWMVSFEFPYYKEH